MKTLVCCAALLLLAACAPAPPPAPLPPLAIQTPPALNASTAQLNAGTETYWQVCMACHGNRGQGLTLEWREEWGPNEMNCWQSRCHAANHPPQGFTFPKVVPAVIGPGTLPRFRTAQELHDSILTSMPWWNPRSLSDDEAWALTAYLLRARGALGDGVVLGPTNASAYLVSPAAPLPADDRPWGLALAGLLGCGGLLVAVRGLRRPSCGV